ncbi:MAG: ADP-ribosylglycohydrolase family protein [Gammaproteobacteria bacterium]|nr:ADP-ribosylglycohydrolase family protein [Gammaproteobacteria bacterium]
MSLFKKFWRSTRRPTPSKQEAALGCLLGACVGDAAGATLEFLGHQPTPDEVDKAVRMPGGGVLRVAPGQITDDGELTLCLARALSASRQFDSEAIARQYAEWVRSKPFDIGFTTRRSLGCFHEDYGSFQEDGYFRSVCEQQGYAAAMRESAAKYCMGSKANGALMRIAPLGVWGYRRDIDELADYARQDSSLSHPEESCWQASACYVIAIASLIDRPGDRSRAFERAEQWAERQANTEVRGWLNNARQQVEAPYVPQIGFVRIAFAHAFRHLLLGSDYVSALKETLAGGGDTDTNACIVGGLIGAACGVSQIPDEMLQPVLSCDTRQGAYERPDFLSAGQLPALVEALLVQSGAE